MRSEKKFKVLDTVLYLGELSRIFGYRWKHETKDQYGHWQILVNDRWMDESGVRAVNTGASAEALEIANPTLAQPALDETAYIQALTDGAGAIR